MIKAYHLYTGPDGHSHVTTGTIINHEVIAVESIRFAETAAPASLDHTAPTTQYVITLQGVLEFSTHTGETFTLRPGEILIAEDTTGSGHKWHLNEVAWKRVYVAFKPGTKINFQ